MFCWKSHSRPSAFVCCCWIRGFWVQADENLWSLWDDLGFVQSMQGCNYWSKRPRFDWVYEPMPTWWFVHGIGGSWILFCETTYFSKLFALIAFWLNCFGKGKRPSNESNPMQSIMLDSCMAKWRCWSKDQWCDLNSFETQPRHPIWFLGFRWLERTAEPLWWLWNVV